MGYTHYWNFKKVRGKTNDLELQYQRAVKEIGKIARHWNECFPSGSLERLSGYTAHVKAGSYGGVKLNGKGELSHEDFALREHFTQNDGGFCKTARKPYDVVVVAALALLKHRLGDAISVSSDGYAENWEAGVKLARQVTKLKIKNPIGKEVSHADE